MLKRSAKINTSNWVGLVTNLEIKMEWTFPNFVIESGREPNEELLSENFMEKNISDFYIAGDIKTGKFRQTGIAVGEGIHAAMSVEEYLRGKKE